MTPERRKFLNENLEENLTQQETDDGYCFCMDWDGLLIHISEQEAEVCTCNCVAKDA